MRLIADSTVLIDIWRLRREPHRLLQLRSHLTDPVIPWQVVFEFARGAYRKGVTDAALRRFLAPFGILPITEAQVWQAARIDAGLAMSGQTIGAADTWIAAAALESGLPVLTQNTMRWLGSFTPTTTATPSQLSSSRAAPVSGSRFDAG